MNKTILFLTVLALVACSHGRTPQFPAGIDPASAGQVIVARNNNLFGWGLPVKVTLDETVIAHLTAGEHVAFAVPSGLHTVGIANRGISVPVERNRTYYFLISADASSQAGFEIERLDARRGEEWVSKTRPIP